MSARIESIDDVVATLTHVGYLPDHELATVVFLALNMHRPLFLEGEAGTGKTEVAKSLARALNRPLVRLQCHEGLDLSSAAYEWNGAKQMLAIRTGEAGGGIKREADLYSRDYLIARPLLQALDLSTAGTPPVLLIDELDRADEPFEAFLLEVLADFQISIPELGTIGAPRGQEPIVVVTSNRTREIHDALKRRCLYHWVAYPDAEREWAIVRAKAPDTPESLSKQVVAFVQRLRAAELFKPPGVAETLDWARALTALNAVSLDPAVVRATAGALLKYQDDIEKLRSDRLAELLAA
jgi:MoxR-like ATPase